MLHIATLKNHATSLLKSVANQMIEMFYKYKKKNK